MCPWFFSSTQINNWQFPQQSMWCSGKIYVNSRLKPQIFLYLSDLFQEDKYILSLAEPLWCPQGWFVSWSLMHEGCSLKVLLKSMGLNSGTNCINVSSHERNCDTFFWLKIIHVLCAVTYCRAVKVLVSIRTFSKKSFQGFFDCFDNLSLRLSKTRVYIA